MSFAQREMHKVANWGGIAGRLCKHLDWAIGTGRYAEIDR